jgi:hypothetical protein
MDGLSALKQPVGSSSSLRALDESGSLVALKGRLRCRSARAKGLGEIAAGHEIAERLTKLLKLHSVENISFFALTLTDTSSRQMFGLKFGEAARRLIFLTISIA